MAAKPRKSRVIADQGNGWHDYSIQQRKRGSYAQTELLTVYSGEDWDVQPYVGTDGLLMTKYFALQLIGDGLK